MNGKFLARIKQKQSLIQGQPFMNHKHPVTKLPMLSQSFLTDSHALEIKDIHDRQRNKHKQTQTPNLVKKKRYHTHT